MSAAVAALRAVLPDLSEREAMLEAVEAVSFASRPSAPIADHSDHVPCLRPKFREPWHHRMIADRPEAAQQAGITPAMKTAKVEGGPPR